MNKVAIIGMGLSESDLTKEHINKIQGADILIGGKRHLQYFKEHHATKIIITKDIKTLAAYIKRHMKNKEIVVLASGDPLFFGIGSVLKDKLGEDNIVIYPNVTSVAAAFARIREPWHDAHVISLHGKRKNRELLKALTEKKKIAILTDPEKSPSWLADFLITNKITRFKICILEQLGTSSERIGWYEPSQAAGMSFSEPNIIILKSTTPESVDNLFSGIPESWFDHENGIITKSEIRAVTTSKLKLLNNSVLWDLGSGSGSVAIEASLFIKKGRIIAVEKKQERINQIKSNVKRFRIKNIDIIHSLLPEGLGKLPRPDRIFVGGGGKDLDKIIASAIHYLKDNGIIVINAVLLSSVDSSISILKKFGFRTNVVQVQISRGSEMFWGTRLEAQNPVWIVSGEK